MNFGTILEKKDQVSVHSAKPFHIKLLINHKSYSLVLIVNKKMWPGRIFPSKPRRIEVLSQIRNYNGMQGILRQ